MAEKQPIAQIQLHVADVVVTENGLEIRLRDTDIIKQDIQSFQEIVNDVNDEPDFMTHINQLKSWIGQKVDCEVELMALSAASELRIKGEIRMAKVHSPD